jgi:CRISPR-associated protein Cmr5
MSVTDLSKERSQYAFKSVKEVIEKFPNIKDKKTKKLVPSKQQKDYKSYVKKIPMMILNNGLGATFAFVYSRRDVDAYNLIYNQTNEWLKKDDKNDLIDWIINLESSEYRAVTNEVLALFNWLKRFADGMIEGEDNDS